MTDVHTTAVRSKNMSAIRPVDTKPEVRLRKALFARGFRYRKNVKSLPGKPDIVLPKYRAIIQVNGCFWHGHNCHLFKYPSTHQKFWFSKIQATKKRDAHNALKYHELSWRVLTIWECAMKGKTKLPLDQLISLVETWIVVGNDIIDITGDNKEN